MLFRSNEELIYASTCGNNIVALNDTLAGVRLGAIYLTVVNHYFLSLPVHECTQTISTCQ